MFHRTIFHLLAVWIGISGAGAEETTLREMLSRNWNSRDGLPANHVQAIVRTRDGFLWLGTTAGLARFDGVQFETYGLREGLQGVNVFSLLAGRDGTLWVGTFGGGVSALRGGKIERTYTVADGLPSASVTSLIEDRAGDLWAASGVGFARLDNGRFVPVPGAPGGRPAEMNAWFCDRSGVLWIALGKNGIWRWNSGSWSRGTDGGPATAAAMCEDGLGRLWIGEDKTRRLWRRDEKGWQSFAVPEDIPGSAPFAMTATADGTVWTAFDGGGVCGIKDERFSVPRLRSASPFEGAEAFCAAPDGQLWVGTGSRGLYALSLPRTEVAALPGSSTQWVMSLLELAPGEFAVGTRGQGILRWHDGRAESWDAQLNTAACTGRALLRTRDGGVWIGTDAGLREVRSSQRVQRPDLEAMLGTKDVLALCQDGSDGLWVGTGRGELYHISPMDVRKIDYGGHFQGIRALLQEPDETLWIGTAGDGLYRLRGTEHRHYDRGDGLASNLVFALYRTGNGVLWVGTVGGGLARRAGTRFESLTTAEGLPDNTVSQILGDAEGRLWLGTNRGLVVLQEEELKAAKSGGGDQLHSLLVNHADGLLSDECADAAPPVKTSDGRFAFATTCGFVLLRPGDFHLEHSAPPVFIDQVAGNGRVAELRAGRISLAPGLERLEFRYTGLYFSAPEQLRFRHRLEGLETAWNEAGEQRSVEYRNLAPGTYHFEVAASSGNGLWTTPPAVVELVLAPFWWQTWWARAAAGLAAAGCLASAAVWSERVRSRRKIEALERRHAVDAERARIARDLHDDVGSSLTQVALLSELARTSLTAQPERADDHINEIFTTARELTRTLDEIVWAVNPAHDTVKSFALFLCSLVQTYTRSAGLESRLDIPKVLPAAPLDPTIRHHLYLATKEALHNIVKHAAAHEIRLGMQIDSARIQLTIADDGQGFLNRDCAPAGADGLLNLQKRLSQIGGRCTCRSEPGRGTSVEILAPLRCS